MHRTGAEAGVTAPGYRGSMASADHYANAVRAVPGHCWRMVSRGPGYRWGTLLTARSRCDGWAGPWWVGSECACGAALAAVQSRQSSQRAIEATARAQTGVLATLYRLRDHGDKEQPARCWNG
jgi:hypothetical protein